MRQGHCAAVSDVRMVVADGVVYATHPTGTYTTWELFARSFDRLTVAARRAEAGLATGPVTGPGVEYVGLPNYSGARQFVAQLPRLIIAIWSGVAETDLYLLRLPEPLSVLAALRCVARRQPFVAMIVADVGGYVHPSIPPAVARAFANLLRRVVRSLVLRAAGTIYVTQTTLQQRIPPPPGRPTIGRSNVRLDQFPVVESRRTTPHTRVMIAVGTQQSQVKGHDIAIEALRILRERDDRYRLVLVGGGRAQPELRKLAVDLRVSEFVEFRGHLSDPAEVRAALVAADIMVAPARSEGLSRALLEGLATGLPAVATAVGGTEEVLDSDCLVEPEDARGLADRICSIFETPGRYRQLSSLSIAAAQDMVRLTSPARLAGFFDAVRESLGVE